MGCENCSSGQSCGGSERCNSGGCSRLHVFDWLSNISLPEDQEEFDGIEVRFKNGRKEFYRNTHKLPLTIGDTVAVEAESGHDIGIISLKGELVKIQMRKKKTAPKDPAVKKIYRKATQKDIDVWKAAIAKEDDYKIRSREMASRLGLKMKISDVEFQGDDSKATFYYTADQRVDFRELIKEMARAFRIRIEMRQIGLRQEAARLGGISTCGRELCCSTWLTDFRSVSTKAARYQQLSLNPEKLAGQCGKLKCCLNFELDSYLDALKDFPKKDTKLVTKKGKADCRKMDIFKGIMWYTYEEEPMNWHQLNTKQVKKIIEAAKAGNPVESLEEFVSGTVDTAGSKADFDDVVGQDSLTRFDETKQKKRRKRKKKHKQRKKHD